ncbi:NB-ARC domain-containing protein [Trichocoleus sp. FACHB-262]|uniref:WD40 domain-containing protein n=1 Tax=Trichocoleus sp. FACHB-262 TaxID=2692869 RepID=UPI00168A3A7A|nr:NB-ARC domain-containing protein [Trichocoleus sp. FACHB-262]MBD2120279.1 NACHT domain-containing protein [Trichocoleus sp. FACHB-262]
MPRSLKVRQDCIGQVKLSVRRNGFPSQQALAEELGLARSTVVNFLTGRPVDRAVFEDLCLRLSLNSQEIAEMEFVASATTSQKLGIDAVRKSRDLKGAPDVSFFFGRELELATLKQWILQEQCKLITVFGVGGIGKTTLSVKLAHQIEEGFDYVIWRSLRNAPPLDALLVDLIQFLTPMPISKLPETLDGKIASFLECLQQRCLLVLDNYETILQERIQAGAYRVGYENYSSLLKCISETHHKSCVVLTSREKPAEVVQLEGLNAPVRSLQVNGLSEVEGYKVFEVQGYSGSKAELEPLIGRYGGNPLALKVIATTLQEFFNGNVADLLGQEILFFGDIWKLLSEQFNRLTAIEKQIMYWLALERDWVSLGELREKLFPTVTARELLEALDSLQRRSLLEKRAGCFTQQSVVMEYTTNQLLEQVFKEVKTGKIALLNSVPLIQAQAIDFVRESQVRLILEPLIKEIQKYFRTEAALRQQLDILLVTIRCTGELKFGYAAGNLLNLYRFLNLNLLGYNFSELVIRQASLQEIELHDVNFSHSEFINSSFTQTFGGILSIQFNPDGQTFATSSTNCEIQVWSVADGQRLLTLQGHTNWVRRIAFDPTGELLASASDDGTLRIWDLVEGTCNYVLSGHNGSLYSVAFSPDGQVIASAGYDCTIRLWNASNGSRLTLLEGHSAGVLAASFSPCGSFLASGSFDHTIRIWDTQTGVCLQTLTEHTNWVTGLNFSPDGQWLASPSCDRTVRVWRVTDWQCVRILEGHTGWVWGIAWNPDSQLLISCSADCTAKIWDATTGECLRSLGGHKTQIWRAVFSPDGQNIATGSEDQTISLWNVETGHCLKTITGHSNWVRPLVLSPDGRFFATGHKDKNLRIWNSADNQCLQEWKAHETSIVSLAFHPGHQLLASGGMDKIVKVWNWQQKKCIAIFEGHSDEVWGLAFSPDGEILASSSFDQTIRLWRLQSKTCLATLTGHSDRVPAMAFHPKGSTLASGSDDGMIKLWDVSTRKCYATLTGHGARVGTVRFNPKGDRLVSASLDQTLKIWNVQTGECLQTLQGHQSWVMGAVFFSDNQTVASAASDQSIKVWNSQTGQCLNTLRGHTNWVWNVAVSPDGRKLISTSEDESIRVWDVQTGDCLATLKPKRPYEGMQITGTTGLTLAQEETLRELGAI